MKMRKWFVVAVAVAVVISAAVSSAVYAIGRGGSDNGVPATAPAPAGNAPHATSPDPLSNCKLSKTAVVTNNVIGLSTTSTSPVTVPGMSTTVKTSKGCVIATVSGFAYAPSGALEYVDVQVDGSDGTTSASQFAGDTQGLWAESHALQFAFAVGKGTHTVAMLFYSYDGKVVTIHQPTMVIAHS